jgi:hypothetical protein
LIEQGLNKFQEYQGVENVKKILGDVRHSGCYRLYGGREALPGGTLIRKTGGGCEFKWE